MPAHNEAEFLEASVHDVLTGLRARVAAGAMGDVEVVVVENGSTDTTATVAARLAAANPEVRVLQLGPADYGRALRAGLLAANGDVVVNFDVDYYDLDFADDALARI